jgi:1,4-dihydroxy-2-naphthoate octaprenyltransferase
LGTNLHNDYADFVMGADTCKRVGQAAARHPKGMWLSPQQTFAGSTMTLTLALAIGLQVIFEHVMMDPVLWFIIKWIFFVTESVLLLRHITTRS